MLGRTLRRRKSRRDVQLDRPGGWRRWVGGDRLRRVPQHCDHERPGRKRERYREQLNRPEECHTVGGKIAYGRFRREARKVTGLKS